MPHALFFGTDLLKCSRWLLGKLLPSPDVTASCMYQTVFAIACSGCQSGISGLRMVIIIVQCIVR